MKYIASLDISTTGVKLLLFDHSAKKIHEFSIEHKQYYPQPGWVEHDAEEIWENTRKVITETLKSTGIKGNEIAGLGITNQRETIVVWDSITGKPLYKAIVWQDSRTREIADKLSKDYSDEFFRQRTGLQPSTYFSAPKLQWLIDNNSGLLDKLESGN